MTASFQWLNIDFLLSFCPKKSYICGLVYFYNYHYPQMIMKRTYQEPVSEAFEILIEGEICLSGGKAGGDGKPGADFDSDDIYEVDDLL